MLSNLSQKLDPRVRRTRKLLKSAFIELMTEQGFDSLTVQDITDRADINRATFYAHFTDKFDLHDQMLVEWFRQQLTQYNVTSEASFCADNLRNLVFAVCDFLKQINGGCHPADTQYKPSLENLVQSEINALIYDWLQSVEGIEKVNILSASISWSIFGASLHWSKQSNASKEDVADTVINLITHGLRAQCDNLPELVEIS